MHRHMPGIDSEGRGITLADWFGPVSKLGGSSFYLATYFDSNGSPLQGANNYRLDVSANVPVKKSGLSRHTTWRHRLCSAMLSDSSCHLRTRTCRRILMAPWTSTLARRHLPGKTSPELLECGNRGAISKSSGKGGKPAVGFPGFPSARHFRSIKSISAASARDRIMYSACDCSTERQRAAYEILLKYAVRF